MKNIHPEYLRKSEGSAAYKKYAETGMDLMFPVRLKGKTHMHDIGIPYHTTIKLFDTTKDKAEHAHEVASRLSLTPPNPKEVHVEPTTLKTRDGHTMHVLKLHGPHADAIKAHHKEFGHLGYQEKYDFHPHITVDKEAWDHVVASKARTAHEAGIEFMPAELRQGHKIVANYQPKVAAPHGGDHQTADKLKKSLTTEVARETISMNLDLRAIHARAISLSDQTLKNYLQDNPGLEKSIIEKHDKRLHHHFGANEELVALAWNSGIRKAYEAKNRK